MKVKQLIAASVLFIFFGFVFFQHAHQATIPHLFTKDLGPHESLDALLRLFEISHDNTLESIVSGTQKNWLRKPGKERWELTSSYSAQARSIILNECSKLGMIHEIKPQRKKYDYAIILGGTVQTMRKRFAHVLELIKQGRTFNLIVFLCGQRPLNKAIESDDTLVSYTNSTLPANMNWQRPAMLPQTETEMTLMIIDQTLLPNDLKEKIMVIDTPCKTGPQGNLLRPTTGDTFASWLATLPQPGTVLVISSQPYVGYQDAVARTFLPKEFTCETIGRSDENDYSDVVLLDTLARWLYQAKQLASKA